MTTFLNFADLANATSKLLDETEKKGRSEILKSLKDSVTEFHVRNYEPTLEYLNVSKKIYYSKLKPEVSLNIAEQTFTIKYKSTYINALKDTVAGKEVDYHTFTYPTTGKTITGGFKFRDFDTLGNIKNEQINRAFDHGKMHRTSKAVEKKSRYPIAPIMFWITVEVLKKAFLNAVSLKIFTDLITKNLLAVGWKK